MFKSGQTKLYWKGVVCLHLCHVTGVSLAFQHRNIDYLHVQQDTLMTKVAVLRTWHRELINMLDTGHTNQNNASVTIGAMMLCFLS